MATVSVHDAAGKPTGTVDLDDAVFGIEPNAAVMHQVVTAQLAARRAGTHNTRTRAEVRGGGAKPWKQKGTGRSRQGSIRSPQWRGGGVALGPKPRSYRQRTPKKMVRLALRSALSDRAADGKVVIVDSWPFETPRTKDAVAALAALGVDGRVLVVVDRADEAAWKSFRNLPSVHVISPGELNAYDVLVADWLVFSTGTLPGDSSAAVDGTVEPAAEAEDEATVDDGEVEVEATAEADAEATLDDAEVEVEATAEVEAPDADADVKVAADDDDTDDDDDDTDEES